MATSYAAFKSMLLLLAFLPPSLLQTTPTFASISQNFCLIMQGEEDNLSCTEDTEEGQACFDRDLLCNGVNDCGGGTDEGLDLSSLECAANRADSMFDCANGFLVTLEQMCDGIDDCEGSARPGIDETVSICDNKCLAPYYGSCDNTRLCVNSRFGVNCGSCFESSMVDIIGQSACGTLVVESVNVAENSMNPSQVCATLSLPVVSPALSVTANVVFSSPGGAVPGGDFTQLTTQITFTSPATNTLMGSTAVQLEECIMFNVEDDMVVENFESFTVTATIQGTDGLMFSSSGIVSITDDDVPEFGFIQPTFTASESISGVAGTLNAQVTITNGVTLAAGTTTVINCNPSVAAGSTAFGGDFTTGVIPLSFSSTATTLICPVPLIDDAIVENDETFQLALSLASGLGSLSASTTTPSIATATIIDDIPQFGFDPATYMLQEGPSRTVFVNIQELNGQTFAPGVTRSLVVNSQTSGGNPATGVAAGSTAGGDYINIINEGITVGAPLFQFPIQLLDDSNIELTETFQLLLSAGAGSIVSIPAASSVGTISLTEDDVTLFQFTMTNFPAAEGPTTPSVEVCVQLTAGSPIVPIQLTLDPSPNIVAAAGDSASSADFQDVIMTIIFATGATVGTEECATFAIDDDNLMEPQEFFTVQATGGMFSGGQDTTQVTIADNDDAAFAFTQAEFNVGEASNMATASIQLVSNTVLASPISIIVTTVGGGGSATGSPLPNIGDFMNTAETLVFAAGSGSGTTLDFNVPLVNDMTLENEEDIDISATIVGTVGSFGGGAVMANAQINIIDDDVLTVAFQQQTYTMVEDSGDQVVCLAVTSGMLSPGVSVMASFTTQPGAISPATPGVDYNPIPDPTSVTFMMGMPIQCVTLDIIPDGEDEMSETFVIIAQPLGGQISIPDTSSDIFITDDDVILAQFSEPRYTVSEGGPAVQICIDMTGGIIGQAGLTINIESIMGGSAEVGSDFSAIDQDIIFQPGTTPDLPGAQQCFFFSAIPDPCVEDQEDIMIQATSMNPDVQFTVNGNQAGIYIVDDDTLPVMIVSPVIGADGAAPNFQAAENGGPVQVCVQAVANAGVLKREVTVTLSTEDGTAVGTGQGVPADFCTEQVVFTFGPGEEGQEICADIEINDDMICEGNENFGLLLESGTDGGTTILNSPGSVTIIDNDVAEITAQVDFDIPENIEMFTINLVLLGQKAPGRQCVVTASTMDGTAVSTGTNPDFVGTVEAVTLDADNQVGFIELEIENDGICEGTESFQVMLTTLTPGCAIQDGVSPININIIDDEIGGGGDDPHFSIVLPSGKLLCYTVQGEHGFSFNLISNKKMTMNARFVPDSRRSEVTWMGSMGIIVRDNMYKQANATALRFEAKEKKIYIGDKVELAAKNIDRMIFKNGKLTISEAPHSEGFKYPSIYVDLQDVEITFTMKFLSEHLDIFWHRTGGKIPDSHGLIGQFFRTGVVVDEVRKILIMPNKEPVPVMRRPVWSFMEREKTDDQLCWTAMNPGYQGEGLIDGTYYDYLVDDVMTSDFQFKKQ